MHGIKELTVTLIELKMMSLYYLFVKYLNLEPFNIASNFSIGYHGLENVSAASGHVLDKEHWEEAPLTVRVTPIHLVVCLRRTNYKDWTLQRWEDVIDDQNTKQRFGRRQVYILFN
jgi:hypothetical protein